MPFPRQNRETVSRDRNSISGFAVLQGQQDLGFCLYAVDQSLRFFQRCAQEGIQTHFLDKRLVRDLYRNRDVFRQSLHDRREVDVAASGNEPGLSCNIDQPFIRLVVIRKCIAKLDIVDLVGGNCRDVIQRRAAAVEMERVEQDGGRFAGRRS